MSFSFRSISRGSELRRSFSFALATLTFLTWSVISPLSSSFAETEPSCGKKLSANSQSSTVVIRPLPFVEDIKLLTFNMFNFNNKPAQAKVIAKTVLKIDADILILQEVIGGVHTIHTFDDSELGDQYYEYFTKHPPVKGINNSILIKKAFPFDVQVESHMHEEFLDPILPEDSDPVPVFNRDPITVILREKGKPKDSPPLAIIISNHSKSQTKRRNSSLTGKDPLGKKRRTAQMERLKQIIENYKRRFGKHARIILGGDFNANPNSTDLDPIQSGARMKEVFDLLSNPPPRSERVTYGEYPSIKGKSSKQPDMFFVSESLQSSVKDVSIYRYAEDEVRGSDHFPLVLTLQFNRFYTDYLNELEQYKRSQPPEAPAPQTSAPQSSDDVKEAS